MSIQREYHVENAKNKADLTVPFSKSSKMHFDKNNANNTNSMITPGGGGGRRKEKKKKGGEGERD